MTAVLGPLLQVENLAVEFRPRRGRPSRPVDGVSLTVSQGEIVGIVGESGCGKSLTMLGILNLLPPGGRIAAGRVLFDGVDLATADRATLTKLRGRQVALIPSDAGAALNPVARVSAQLELSLATHRTEPDRRARRARVVDMLQRVHLPDPARKARLYPHELSGGMQQRVAVALGLQNGPRLLIADEPTTALDVTVQAQILQLLLEVRERDGTGILFVTHDMTTVAEICDRVVVMYAGRVVEQGAVDEVCASPRHPYTRALLASVPPLGGVPPDELETIHGIPPDPALWPAGCRFHPRCPRALGLGSPESCTEAMPVLEPSGGREVACHFADQPVEVRT